MRGSFLEWVHTLKVLAILITFVLSVNLFSENVHKFFFGSITALDEINKKLMSISLIKRQICTFDLNVRPEFPILKGLKPNTVPPSEPKSQFWNLTRAVHCIQTQRSVWWKPPKNTLFTVTTWCRMENFEMNSNDFVGYFLACESLKIDAPRPNFYFFPAISI